MSSESYYLYTGTALHPAVSTPQHYHWYAATRCAFPTGQLTEPSKLVLA